MRSTRGSENAGREDEGARSLRHLSVDKQTNGEEEEEKEEEKRQQQQASKQASKNGWSAETVRGLRSRRTKGTRRTL
jgi:hypothetical protein